MQIAVNYSSFEVLCYKTTLWLPPKLAPSWLLPLLLLLHPLPRRRPLSWCLPPPPILMKITVK
jgi:hypothetical protein